MSVTSHVVIISVRFFLYIRHACSTLFLKRAEHLVKDVIQRVAGFDGRTVLRLIAFALLHV